MIIFGEMLRPLLLNYQTIEENFLSESSLVASQYAGARDYHLR